MADYTEKNKEDNKMSTKMSTRISTKEAPEPDGIFAVGLICSVILTIGLVILCWVWDNNENETEQAMIMCCQSSHSVKEATVACCGKVKEIDMDN